MTEVVEKSPLSYLVITAPTSSTATFYQLTINYLCTKLNELKGCHCYCVSDPEGYRIGSG